MMGGRITQIFTERRTECNEKQNRNPGKGTKKRIITSRDGIVCIAMK